ncbi:MAG: GNAT family N-acetyltransferase [Lachnospiraceae bacterium]|nr:GNAT family N-acetyltransferase [Lachnospiraceae bacterium]
MYAIIKCSDLDIDRLVDFYNDAVKYLDEHINYPKWKYGLYPARESISTAVAAGTQYACLENGEILGAFVLNDDPQGAYEKGEWSVSLDPGEFLVVHTLATAPKDYGKGVAKFIIEYCIQTARDEGYKAIRLDIVPGNIPAQKLYERLGFKCAGEKDLLRDFDDIPSFILYEYNIN